MAGVVSAYERATPCGPCVQVPVVPAPCVRGCREGARAADAAGTCIGTAPAHVGDACNVDADCSPAAPTSDGHGGEYLPMLTCDANGATCVAAPLDVCDGTDDDADGTVDEGCVCHPRVIARLGLDLYGDAAFGGSRVALHTVEGASEALLVVDESTGAVLGHRSDASLTSLVRDSAGFVGLERASDGTGTLVSWGDDDVITTSSMSSPPAALRRWGAGWLGVSGRTPGEPWALTRYDAAFDVVARGSLAHDGAASWLLAELADGSPLVLELESTIDQGTLRVLAIDDALVAHEREPTTFVGWPAMTAHTADRLWVALYDSGGPALVAMSRGTGAWTGEHFAIPQAFSTFPESPPGYAVAAHGEHVLVSYLAITSDSGSFVRTSVYDTSGILLGTAVVPVAESYGSRTAEVMSGLTDGGVRVVTGSGVLIAPCDEL